MEEMIKNIIVAQRRIKAACKSRSRDLCEIKLLLATKIASTERIKIALLVGTTLIAKNKDTGTKGKV